MTQRFFAFLLGASGFLIALCRTAGARLPWSKPACRMETSAGGWAITAELARAEPGGLLVSKWQTRHDYAHHFGLRVTLDTNENPEPILQLWHNYKNGDFRMTLPDNGVISTSLDSRYAITEVPLRPIDFDLLRSQPVRFEYTSPDIKWSVHHTDGLPEAIAKAEASLARLKQQDEHGDCAP